MIHSYGDAETRQLFETGECRRFRSMARVAIRKLQQMNAAAGLHELLSPPGNRLERLKGDRAGQHSIRINDQWQICFRWHDGNAYEVEIADYHH